MGFATESQELKELSFCIILEGNYKIFKKNAKYHIFWALFAQLWAKMNFPQNLGLVTF